MKNYRDEKHKKLVMLIAIYHFIGIVQSIVMIRFMGYSQSSGTLTILINLFIIIIALVAPLPEAILMMM